MNAKIDHSHYWSLNINMISILTNNTKQIYIILFLFELCNVPTYISVHNARLNYYLYLIS